MMRPYLDSMSYDALQNLRNYHPAWKLLAATRAPFVISFLHAAFVLENQRELPEYRLMDQLRDYLEQLEQEGTEAKALLTQWAEDGYGWLRKFYPANSDEVHYDLTSAAQKAIEWVESLKKQNFIGTESRLLMVFSLFHEIVDQSDADPERRIQELERRKSEIEQEILQIQLGNIKVLAPVQIKERYLQAMQLSREILVDFRAVEQNFRDLRQAMQEKIARWDKGKGELLEDFFHNQDGIEQSEQGKSFQAFFDFLMSPAAQDDFEETIAAVSALEQVKALPGSKSVHRILSDWVVGSKHVQGTLAAISEQLRRYVDENFMQEERRINHLIKQIEAAAIALRNAPPSDTVMQLDAPAPELNLPFDRPLFVPPGPNKMADPHLVYGTAQQEDDCALYTHVSVNKDLLLQQIHHLLQQEPKVTLAQVVEVYPIRLGLAEVLGYLSLAQQSSNAFLEPAIHEPISWLDTEQNWHKATLCRIVYHRHSKEDKHNG